MTVLVPYAAGSSDLIELVDDQEQRSPFPLVRCRNLYVLPGVPALLQQKWRTLRVCLRGLYMLSWLHALCSFWMRLLTQIQGSQAPNIYQQCI